MKIQEYYLLILFGLSVGVCITTQSGLNATLKTALSSPIQSAFISFLVGTITLGIIAFSHGNTWFNADGLSKLPWWAWVGGALGAFNITMSVYLVPKLGALLLGASIITGQIIASLAFDHFGLIGYPKIDVTAHRLIGACLIMSGLYYIAHK